MKEEPVKNNRDYSSIRMINQYEDTFYIQSYVFNEKGMTVDYAIEEIQKIIDEIDKKKLEIMDDMMRVVENERHPDAKEYPKQKNDSLFELSKNALLGKRGFPKYKDKIEDYEPITKGAVEDILMRKGGRRKTRKTRSRR